MWPIGGELLTTITSPSCWGTHFLYLSNPPSGNLLPIIPCREPLFYLEKGGKKTKLAWFVLHTICKGFAAHASCLFCLLGLQFHQRAGCSTQPTLSKNIKDPSLCPKISPWNVECFVIRIICIRNGLLSQLKQMSQCLPLSSARLNNQQQRRATSVCLFSFST